MQATTILTLYIALFTLSYLTLWILDTLNLNASLKGRTSFPAFFTELIDKAAYQRSIDYSLRKGQFAIKVSFYNHLILLLVILSGILGIADNALSTLKLSPLLHSYLFLLGSSGILLLLNLPIAFYSSFVIEEEFGFNTITPPLYFLDLVKKILLGGILLLIFLTGLHGLSTWTGPQWWLAGWAFFIFFQVLLFLLYPLLIAPLFNKFTPLPEGPLKERLTALAIRTKFGNRGIYSMNGSLRSRHANAYFTGLGRARRIVLFDTLLESMNHTEIEAVLAHEIGHAKKKHIVKRLLVSSLLSLAAFALMGWALQQEEFFKALGFSRPSLHGLLFFITHLSGPLTFLSEPLSNLWSRRHEYQADQYAVDNTGGPQALSSALLKLCKDNLSNLNPHPAYSFWHYSHPAPQERIKALETQENP